MIKLSYYSNLILNSLIFLFILSIILLICFLSLSQNSDISTENKIFFESNLSQKLLFHYVMPNPAIDLTFLGYLSILSIDNNHINYEIYYHSDSKLSGYWYDQLSIEIKNKITIHSLPLEITSKTYYESDTNKIVTNIPIISDIIRLHILYKYGGFYLDWDVIITNNLFELTNYEFVIGSEIISPGTLNHLGHIFNSIYEVHSLSQGLSGINGLANSFMFAKPNNNFVRTWLQNFNQISSYMTIMDANIL